MAHYFILLAFGFYYPPSPDVLQVIFLFRSSLLFIFGGEDEKLLPDVIQVLFIHV